MSDDWIARRRALTDELQGVVRAHSLDPETALGALAQVAATQVEAFVMGDALEASGTALSRAALFREAREVVDRFAAGVLGNIAWTIRGG